MGRHIYKIWIKDTEIDTKNIHLPSENGVHQPMKEYGKKIYTPNNALTAE